MKNFNEFILERLNTQEEIEGFTILSSKSSKLPYDLYIDSYKYYKYYNHKPWLYVKAKNTFIPISISDNPSIENANKNVLQKNEFEKIRKFIIANKNLLLKYADDLLDDSDFFHSLKKLNESEELNEMSILKSNKFGIPFDIWIDDGGCWKNTKHNKPRIKIKDEDCDERTTSWKPVIFEEPYTLIDGQTLKMNKKKYDLFLKFIKDEDNNENISKVLNQKLTFEELVDRLNKLDIKGNIIKNPKNNAKEQTN